MPAWMPCFRAQHALDTRRSALSSVTYFSPLMRIPLRLPVALLLFLSPFPGAAAPADAPAPAPTGSGPDWG